MSQYMWGPYAEYGPFRQGKDGYPASGEVVRHYRMALGMSATTFGELYGKALAAQSGKLSEKPSHEKPKSRIWVLTMEKRNTVPTDITRRRVIADLLGIPYLLLGLGESIAKQPVSSFVERATIPAPQTMAQQALTEYQQTLSLYFQGYYSRHSQAALDHLALTTQQLAHVVSLLPGQIKPSGIALLSRYHQFGVMIAREQRNYPLALTHADQAVRCAEEAHKMKPGSDLVAITLYRRGITSFEQAITQPDGTGNIQSAFPFLESALATAQHATLSTKGFLSLEWALVHASAARSEKEKKQVRTLLEHSYQAVSQRPSGPDEEFVNFTPDWYHLTCAEALIALGDYVEALGELEMAEELTPLTLPRRFAYIDALRAKAHLELHEAGEATRFARDALATSKTVKSEFNIARIALISTQLAAHRRSRDLTELERELKKTHPYLVRE